MRDGTINGHDAGASLLSPLWKIVNNTLAAAQNRIELFQLEAQEEKVRLLAILLLASAITVLGTLAVAVATFVIAIMVWQNGWLIILSCLGAVYALGAFWAWRALGARLKGEAPFSATVGELRKDRECLPR